MNPILKKVLRPLFRAVARLPISNPHHNVIEMMVRKQKPVCIISMEQMNYLKNNPEQAEFVKKFNYMTTIGEIVFIDEIYSDQHNTTTQVYAQADKVENGKELFYRCFVGGDEYPVMNSWEEAHERVGELLGYSKIDVKRHKVTGFADKVLLKTSHWRRNIRKELELK